MVVGESFGFKLDVRGEARSVEVSLMISVTAYTGGRRRVVKTHQGTVTAPGSVGIGVTAAEYVGLLHDSSFPFEFSAYCRDPTSGIVWVDHKNVCLSAPALTITAPPELAGGIGGAV